ncbi:uncharacterized protein LOC62_01G000499 [Vanrija pseudolonga]|uniref:Wax synthase domain-containing protein n=1 Tax=Vanrija pseudolonga TaxID=143232 RepID=A0AAF1BEQ6_9TREE|nr:hypothetical protein LOC62_01G000499 [Vanrija pseudolonga]
MADTTTTTLPWLVALHAALPTPHKYTILEVHAGFGLVALTIAALVPPPTRSVRLMRAALAPLICLGYAYLAWVSILPTPRERWGTAILFVNFILRTLELLVFYPPEEGMYRILPIRVRTGASDTITFAPEPVPEGWTTAKLAWAASLWWSWRGIGWNYSPPLSPSQLQYPYAPGSSRRDYLVRRGLYFLLVHAAEDIASSFMRLGAPAYFLDGTVPYSSLTQFQRGLYSLATVERVWYSLELSHVLMSLVFVAAGGIFGLEGEIFSPWGWPPLFGSIANMWEYPGLAFMWSKAWNQYNRRILQLYAWSGIGEGLLGLLRSGDAVKRPRPRVPKVQAAAKGNGTSNGKAHVNGKANGHGHALLHTNGHVLTESSFSGKGAVNSHTNIIAPPRRDNALPTPPATPLPLATPMESPVPSRRASPALPLAGRSNTHMASNLIKSAIVFAFSGLHHDVGSLVMALDKVRRGEPVRAAQLLSLSPFFMIQPLGLVIEALVSKAWRAYKRRRGYPPSQHASTFERAVGFVWTWLWLGWTAGFFVQGMAESGVWRYWPGTVHWSVVTPVYKWIVG